MKYSVNMLLYDTETKQQMIITDMVMKGDTIVCASIRPVDDDWPCNSVVTPAQLDKMLPVTD